MIRVTPRPRPGRARRASLPAVLRVLMVAFAPAPATPAQDLDPAHRLEPPPLEPVVIADLLRIRTVTAIDVARDGGRAVYAVRSVAESPDSTDDRPDHEYRTHLWTVDLTDRTAQPRQLTWGRRNDRDPAISPDGRRVAFVRAGSGEDEATEKPQVWVLPLEGGEARPVTSFANGASGPVWSPDGRHLLVASELKMDEVEGTPPWPQERPGRTWRDAPLPPEPNQDDAAAPDAADPTTDTTDPAAALPDGPDGSREALRLWLARNERRQNPVAITRLDFQGEHDLAPPFEFRHLFLVPAEPDEPIEREAAQRLTHGFFNHAEPAFLPDGSRIVCVRRRDPEIHPDRVLVDDLWSFPLDGREGRVLLALESHTLTSPKPGPDGTTLAFLARRVDQPSDRPWVLGLLPLPPPLALDPLPHPTPAPAPAEPVWVTEPDGSSVAGYDWLPARHGLVVRIPEEGEFPLLLFTNDTLEPERVAPAPEFSPGGVQAFDAGGAAVAYSLTTPHNPCVLRARTAWGTWTLHDLNPWTARKTLSNPEPAWVERPDGTRVQYWVMPPTELQPGREYPVVLEIHGGPSAMWGPGEATMWHEFQLLANWGYAVVYANPRGSGGYGYEFQRANFQNWGPGPAGDVLAALDDALELPFTDEDRLLVTGGSYAGYLTAWILGHTDRFDAAVAQRGVYDLDTFFGEGNAWRLLEFEFGGHPWEPPMRPVLFRESPFSHVARIRTPLLIMHASNDLRTGVSQSEMLYRALKVLGRPVEYVRYPDAGHDLSRTGDPLQRMDRLARIIEFFERHVDNPRPAPALPSEPVSLPPVTELIAPGG